MRHLHMLRQFRANIIWIVTFWLQCHISRAGATDSGLGGSLFRKGALGGRGPFLSEPTFYYVKYLLSCFNPGQTNELYLYAALSAPLHCHATQRSTISPAVSPVAETP